MSVTTTNTGGNLTPSPAPDPAPRDGIGTRLVNFFRAPPAELPQEALEFFSPCQSVMSRPPVPLATKVVSIFGTMTLTLVIIFCTVRTDRIVSGAGKIVSLTPETVVQPLNQGIVKTIAVAAGDIVRKGQLLAQIDQTPFAADNTAAATQVDGYQSEIDRLQAELHQVPYKPKKLTPAALVEQGIYAQRAAAREAELRYYQGQIDAQRALVSQANANIRQYAKETGIAADIESIRARLEADAVGSQLDRLAATSARLETERNVLVNIDQARASQQNVAALQGQLDNYNQTWFADVSQTIGSDEVQLAQYQDALEHAAMNLKLTDLRAQEDSIVLSVAPLSIGSVVQGGQTFFTLVPINAPLEVDVQVTSNEGGYMSVGMPANVKFETWSFLSHGMGSGAVRVISADSFLTGSGSAGSTTSGSSSGTASDAVFTGQNPLSPYFYDVRVSLDRLALRNVPPDFHVTPGMAVTADIKIGDRTIFDYFLERMIPIVYEGMREPT